MSKGTKDEIKNKKCYKHQIDVLQNISIETYYDAFRSFTSEETVNKYLQKAYNIKNYLKK
jgi:hypothetical protein